MVLAFSGLFSQCNTMGLSFCLLYLSTNLQVYKSFVWEWPVLGVQFPHKCLCLLELNIMMCFAKKLFALCNVCEVLIHMP
jgi:hypothetical protein